MRPLLESLQAQGYQPYRHVSAASIGDELDFKPIG